MAKNKMDSFEVLEEELIADRTEDFIIWRVGITTLYVFQLHDYSHLDDFPSVFFDPFKSLARYLVLESHLRRSNFMEIIFKFYPALPSREAHDRFLRHYFVELYNQFYVEQAEHVGFFAVWCFSITLMLYIIRHGLGRLYIRDTILMLSRMFNSSEFYGRCSFFTFNRFARLKMSSLSRMQAWREMLVTLSNRPASVRFDISLRQFLHQYLTEA